MLGAMRNTRKTFRLAPLALAVALTVAACGSDEDSAPASADTSSTQEDSGTSEAHNAADVSFAVDMIPHHRQAIQMADAVFSRENTTLGSLAEQIKAAQDPEIETMSQWLTTWGEEVPEGTGGMGSMDMNTMMSSEDMDSLMRMDGTQFDAMWLRMMIEHHRGAIEMAEVELAEGEQPEVKELASSIIEAQQQEITTMEQMAQALAD